MFQRHFFFPFKAVIPSKFEGNYNSVKVSSSFKVFTFVFYRPKYYQHRIDCYSFINRLYKSHCYKSMVIICLLDATYKTIRYAIPLFFLVVNTNSDYQVVGSFAVQDEITIAISEALAVLKSWNPDWDPKCFMVDNCEEEICSIESIFRGMHYLSLYSVVLNCRGWWN